jgi:hypothetical protein
MVKNQAVPRSAAAEKTLQDFFEVFLADRVLGIKIIPEIPVLLPPS